MITVVPGFVLSFPERILLAAVRLAVSTVPWGYLGWAALYAGLYATVALLIALVLFQDRDLA